MWRHRRTDSGASAPGIHKAHIQTIAPPVCRVHLWEAISLAAISCIRNSRPAVHLYDTGWGFPAFVPAGKTKVTVELIEIPIQDWADVDRLEGYPRLYDRLLTDFRLPDGSTVQAEQAEVIPSGNWKTR